MSRSDPLYPLREVQDLAKSQEVTFTERATEGYEALGFSFERACDVIAWLDVGQFRKTLYYDTTKLSWDDYVADCSCGLGQPSKRVYIKLRITAKGSLAVTSFHTENPLPYD